MEYVCLIIVLFFVLLYIFSPESREAMKQGWAEGSKPKVPDHITKKQNFLQALEDHRSNPTDTAAHSHMINLSNQYALSIGRLWNINEKRQAYAEMLALLRTDPTNPLLNDLTLRLGRISYSATRQGQKLTIYDETALANDIRAATANASQITNLPSAAHAANVVQTTSVEERITALKKMRDTGLISEQEYEEKRKQIIDSI